MAFFTNTPINKTVRAASLSNVTFHRVVATVNIGDSAYKQSQPVSHEGQSLDFDLSSSVNAYVKSIGEDQNSVSSMKTIACIVFQSCSRTNYMLNGQAQKRANSSWSGQVAIAGGYTDMERMRGASANVAESASFTLRPSSTPMLVPAGYSILTYSRSGASRSASMSSVTQETSGIFTVPASARWTAFQFVNTRGLHESAFAQCYASEQIKGGSQTHVRALRETFSTISRRLNVNDPANAALSFSSGFVDLPWAKWWAYEFGKAKHHWMLVDGLWLPCQVTVKDGASIINRSKTELLSVEFDVVPDVDGMI